MKLRKSGYLKSGSRRFDSAAAAIGLIGIVFALASVTESLPFLTAFEPSSLIFICVGTISVIFLQYDLKSIALALFHIAKAFLPLRTAKLRQDSKHFDDLLESEGSITDLDSSGELTGRIAEDVHHLYDKGLSFDEIEEVLSSGFVTEILSQRRSAELFQRASQVAPALGLLGTVIGLVGVLRSLGSPEEIGPAMSLALMTTAYGSALGTLIFGPLAGRLDASTESLLHLQREIVRKAHLLYLRADTNVNVSRKNEAA